MMIACFFVTGQSLVEDSILIASILPKPMKDRVFRLWEKNLISVMRVTISAI
jgi:hypothetical protein